MTALDHDDEFEAFLKSRTILPGSDDKLEPPSALDDLVLSKAREAIHASQQPARTARWATPVALAATILLCLSIALNVTLNTNRRTVSPEPPLIARSAPGASPNTVPIAASAPAPPPGATAAAPTPAALAQATAASSSAAPSVGAPSSAVRQKALPRPSEPQQGVLADGNAEVAAKVSKPTLPSRSNVEPFSASTGADASASDFPAAESPAGAARARASAAPGATTSVAPRAMASTAPQGAISPAAPAPSSAASAAPAADSARYAPPAPSSASSETPAASVASVPPSDSALHPGQVPDTAPSVVGALDTASVDKLALQKPALAKRKARSAGHPQDPKVWLQQIDALRAQGKAAQADAEMQRFRSTFPDYVAKPSDSAGSEPR